VARNDAAMVIECRVIVIDSLVRGTESIRTKQDVVAEACSESSDYTVDLPYFKLPQCYPFTVYERWLALHHPPQFHLIFSPTGTIPFLSVYCVLGFGMDIVNTLNPESVVTDTQG